jgi:protoheme IX farnesyltransferase
LKHINTTKIKTLAKNTGSDTSILSDYAQLVKLKLSITVVFTSILGLLIVSNDSINWISVGILFIGGFLITGSANAINQVLEKDYDVLMKRTANRPVASGRMSVSEAVLFAGIACCIGTAILATFNPMTAVLGMVSFILYSFVYTPLKRYSPIAVSVGAIPGALPVLIGCTAVEGTMSWMALGLFFIQFLWQFPHFWSIGFLGYEDYKLAGFKFIPADEDGIIDRSIGLNGVFYTVLTFPILFGMFRMELLSLTGFCICLTATLIYLYLGLQFDKKFDRPTALRLMFFSFFYMPIILLTVLMVS